MKRESGEVKVIKQKCINQRVYALLIPLNLLPLAVKVQENLCRARLLSALTTLCAIEPRLHSFFLSFSFENIVFPQPAGHDLNPCCLRPIAADVIEASVEDFRFPL